MTSPVRVILASQSPRRRELLGQIGIAHEVRPADIDESYLPHEHPPAHAERLAREKAQRLAAEHPDAVVIGADTIVVIDDEVLGKPSSAGDAERMLRQLSGRTHWVYTAVAVARGGNVASGSRRSRSPSAPSVKRRCATTSRPANRWTRLGPTVSRGSARRWWSVSTATTTP